MRPMRNYANPIRECLFCHDADPELTTAGPGMFRVACTAGSDCDARGPAAYTEDDAVRLWNLPVRSTEASGVLRNKPLYLTNACCEHAHGTPEIFAIHRLNYGQFNGDFYPLTDAEAQYIAEDEVCSDDGAMLALTGYSALYEGRKHIMPTIELPFGDDQPSRSAVIAEAYAYAGRIRHKVQNMGGTVLVDKNMDPDRILIKILVPFEEVMKFENRARWNARLSWLMLDPIKAQDLDIQPIRYEGADFAVEVEYIGEGEDGDFDVTRPEDAPLLRFTAQRRDAEDDSWADIDDGSYCTQVPVYAPETVIKALPAYLTKQLDLNGGAYPKRFLERLSWTSVVDIENFLKDETPDRTG